MVHIHRYLDLELPPGQSLFLWGARKVGKTTFLRERYPRSVFFDLLRNTQPYNHQESVKSVVKTSISRTTQSACTMIVKRYTME